MAGDRLRNEVRDRCPSIGSPDFEFGGAGPNLLVVKGPHGGLRTLVGVGQKSGVYRAFDPSNGNIIWNTLVGPGTSLGGIEWGTAYDLQRIYVPIANPFGVPYNLANGQAASGGSLVVQHLPEPDVDLPDGGLESICSTKGHGRRTSPLRVRGPGLQLLGAVAPSARPVSLEGCRRRAVGDDSGNGGGEPHQPAGHDTNARTAVRPSPPSDRRRGFPAREPGWAYRREHGADHGARVGGSGRAGRRGELYVARGFPGRRRPGERR